MDLRTLFELEPHGPDTFVGAALHYPWGGLYGGHIVAQALRAAAMTVDDEMAPHSLRAYFIRRGDNTEPVRYEVDRIRNGRSFCTRRVVARQAVGAILNLEASFQREESSPDIETVLIPPGVPGPEQIESDSWTELFDRRWVRDHGSLTEARTGAGRSLAWLRVAESFGDMADPQAALLHRCGLAYLSDDLPTDAVINAHPQLRDRPEGEREIFSASLDHTIWFHRPMRSDEWHLHDFTCHSYTAARGLAIGHVFALNGTHVATVAQEVLLRDGARSV